MRYARNLGGILICVAGMSSILIYRKRNPPALGLRPAGPPGGEPAYGGSTNVDVLCPIA